MAPHDRAKESYPLRFYKISYREVIVILPYRTEFQQWLGFKEIVPSRYSAVAWEVVELAALYMWFRNDNLAVERARWEKFPTEVLERVLAEEAANSKRFVKIVLENS